MRAPLSKIYRAFPELDRFNDADCLRFMAEVRSQRWHRVGRALTALLLGFMGFVSSIVTAVVILNVDRNTRFFEGSAGRSMLFAVVLCGVLLIALMPALIARDWLLRRRVRHILTESCCTKCRYSLLGLPVNAENKVQCAECGLFTDVDPAIGQLSISDSGLPVYQGRA